MAAITIQWWRRLVNAYEVKAGVVCLQCKNCDPYLSASEVSFSRWDAIEIYLRFTARLMTDYGSMPGDWDQL